METSNYKLHIIEKHEDVFPKGNLAIDINFFDYDSLVRMYGKVRVDNYIKSIKSK